MIFWSKRQEMKTSKEWKSLFGALGVQQQILKPFLKVLDFFFLILFQGLERERQLKLLKKTQEDELKNLDDQLDDLLKHTQGNVDKERVKEAGDKMKLLMKNQHERQLQNLDPNQEQERVSLAIEALKMDQEDEIKNLDEQIDDLLKHTQGNEDKERVKEAGDKMKRKMKKEHERQLRNLDPKPELERVSLAIEALKMDQEDEIKNLGEQLDHLQLELNENSDQVKQKSKHWNFCSSISSSWS